MCKAKISEVHPRQIRSAVFDITKEELVYSTLSLKSFNSSLPVSTLVLLRCSLTANFVIYCQFIFSTCASHNYRIHVIQLMEASLSGVCCWKSFDTKIKGAYTKTNVQSPHPSKTWMCICWQHCCE